MLNFSSGYEFISVMHMNRVSEIIRQSVVENTLILKFNKLYDEGKVIKKTIVLTNIMYTGRTIRYFLLIETNNF